MKFAIAALLGLVSASNMQAEVKIDQVFLKDEMEALLELVQQVETREQSEIFDTIEVRKEVLKSLAGEMPERKQAIANEVANLSNVVGRVLEEDYDGAVDELEARKNELMDIHNYLTSLVDAGTYQYNMWTQNASGQGTQANGFANIVIGDDGAVSGGVDYGLAAENTYAEDTAVTVNGKYQADPFAENPDAEKWTTWAEGANIYWTENEANAPFYYSGVMDAEGKITGTYKKDGDEAHGTFEFTRYTAPEPPTQPEEGNGTEKAKQIANDIIDKTAEAARKAKEALQGKNGLAIGLGVGGGLLATCAILYCLCCKKKPDMMDSDGVGEGGQKQNRQSLLVQTEEA